jgi:serine/threonine-protein kinase
MQEAEQIPTGANPATESGAGRDPLLGTVLLKRYEVIDQIGTGRFSVVYKARQLLMNRLVAIKSLKRDLLDEKEVVARFKKEARALSRLRHPNIVAVFDCFESQNGRPYLVMDYLDGMSLEDLLAKDQFLSPEMAKPIFLQVCDALAHAHKQGVLHRDLKPGNMVLLAETKGSELVQLVDFGLAQVEEEVQKLTQDGECCGSPAYMSPEHCTGETLDGRSDIYSFGVVMYETLTGVVPFKGRTSVETMRLQVYENAPTFGTVRPDLNIPSEVQQVVMKCLEKDPGKRYQTAGQLKDVISNWAKQTTRAPRQLPRSLTGEAPAVADAPSKDGAQPQAKKTRVKEFHTDNSGPGPTTDKLKRWTETQQKASALRVPIVVGCFIVAVGLAVFSTLVFSHQGGTKLGGEDSMDFPPVKESDQLPGGSASKGSIQQPISVGVPPSTVSSASVPSATTPSLSVSPPSINRWPGSEHPSEVKKSLPQPVKPPAPVKPPVHDVVPPSKPAPEEKPTPVEKKPAVNEEPVKHQPPAPSKPPIPSFTNENKPAPAPKKVVNELPVKEAPPKVHKPKRHPAKPKPATPREASPATPPPAQTQAVPPPSGHRHAYQTY